MMNSTMFTELLADLTALEDRDLGTLVESIKQFSFKDMEIGDLERLAIAVHDLIDAYRTLENLV